MRPAVFGYVMHKDGSPPEEIAHVYGKRYNVFVLELASGVIKVRLLRLRLSIGGINTNNRISLLTDMIETMNMVVVASQLLRCTTEIFIS